jgi:hypothetical protein
MAQVNFGMDQLKNPTPAKIGRIVTIMSVVLGVFIGWSSSTNIIPHPADDYVNGILGLFMALTNALKPLFGVDIPSNVVATKDVTEVDRP